MEHERPKDATNGFSYTRFFLSIGIQTFLSHAMKHNSIFIANFLTPLTMHTHAKTTLVIHSKSRIQEWQQTGVGSISFFNDCFGFVAFLIVVFWFLFVFFFNLGSWRTLLEVPHSNSVRRQQQPKRKMCSSIQLRIQR